MEEINNYTEGQPIESVEETRVYVHENAAKLQGMILLEKMLREDESIQKQYEIFMGKLLGAVINKEN